MVSLVELLPPSDSEEMEVDRALGAEQMHTAHPA